MNKHMHASKTLAPLAFAAVLALALAFSLVGCAGTNAASRQSKLSADDPVTVTVWNYYTGTQLDSFNELVYEFNRTRGKELGIEVQSTSQGSLEDLESAVIAAADKKVGAGDVPTMFPAYADIARSMDERGIVQDLSSCLTDAEKAEYVDGYLTEGDLDGTGGLKIFPIAKATEVMVLNRTDWDKFAQATGATTGDLATVEGVAQTAARYYDWTDGLTSAPDDGKALFGRDAMANYLIIGSQQLGHELIGRNADGTAALDFDKTVARKLWDNYYVPYLNGYYSAIGRFRSDDMKTGNVIAYVGSSASASFTPTAVTPAGGARYSIDTQVLPAPEFEGGKSVAVQQGAGMVVTKSDEKQVEGAVAFLKWFTQPEHNAKFALDTSYLPVKKSANNVDEIASHADDESTTEAAKQALATAVSTVNGNEMYTPSPVKNGTSIRSVVESALSDKATADRKAVTDLMAGGTRRADAVAKYATDANFEAWYADTLAKLEAAAHEG